MTTPYQSGQCEATDLAPGDRILIAGRLGTFVNLLKSPSLPNTITWLPDGTETFEFEVTLWPGKVTRSGWHRSE